jgi:predicted anti-sigma-YlaC factor YlaD
MIFMHHDLLYHDLYYGGTMKKTIKNLFILPCLFLVPLSSCTSIAMNAVSNALTGNGSSQVFTGDPDPELVKDAIPFAIKMYESLLASNPDHQGLILPTGSLFVMYANAFVQGPAQMLPQSRYEEREAANFRAKNLYLRGVDILYGGLDKKYPGFSASYKEGTLDAYLAKTKKEDTATLYWITAGTLAAFSCDPFDLSLGMRLPEVVPLIHRAYELDPDFNNGALDDFFVLFYASLPPSLGGDKAKAEEHFKLALEKSKGLLAGPYVSYAEAICIPAQDYDTFESYLQTALTLDVNADPANRLANVLSQRKAKYLLDTASNYFPELGLDEKDSK